MTKTKYFLKESDNAKPERFSDCAVDGKIDGRVEDEEQVVEGDENDECCRIWKPILFGAKDVMILQALFRMDSLKENILNLKLIQFCYSELYVVNGQPEN